MLLPKTMFIEHHRAADTGCARVGAASTWNLASSAYSTLCCGCTPPTLNLFTAFRQVLTKDCRLFVKIPPYRVSQKKCPIATISLNLFQRSDYTFSQVFRNQNFEPVPDTKKYSTAMCYKEWRTPPVQMLKPVSARSCSRKG